MEYISYSFIAFMAAGLILYALLPKSFGKYVLLLASLLFVGLSGGAFSLIFLALGVCVSFFGAAAMERSKSGAVRTGIFLFVLIFHLGLLFYFKYQNFGEYTKELLGFISGEEYYPELIERSAPVGISFYTLMLIGYAADVYMGKYRAETSLPDFSLYASYFGHIVQGPIDAYDEVGHGMAKQGGIRYEDLIEGGLRLCLGLFKKLVISERLALMVNMVFPDYMSYSWGVLLLCAAAFSLQLYTDFSGCMDIVCGASRMFGIRLSVNFRQPFFSQSVAEFWRRWHITLGAFLRKYIYIPLGGNRKGLLRKHLNTIAVFFISGLWHGGNWTYVIGTGLLHCVYMILGEHLKTFNKAVKGALHISEESKLLRIVRSLWVFVLVTIGFVFFRSDSVISAVGYLSGIVALQESLYGPVTLELLGLSASDAVILVIGLVLIFLLSLQAELGRDSIFAWKDDRASAAAAKTKASASANASSLGGQAMAQADAASAMTAGTSDGGAAVMGGASSKLLARKETLLFVMVAVIILFGCYGRGYDASAFIYATF